jgi:hypothetical protein
MAAVTPLAELTVTVWPLRIADVANARPTLPAPMIAMFMEASLISGDGPAASTASAWVYPEPACPNSPAHLGGHRRQAEPTMCLAAGRSDTPNLD